MNTNEKLMSLIQGFDTVMLVTHDAQGIDARPMAVARLDDDGSMWFATNRDSGKIASLDKDSKVAMTMQSGRKFVTLSGTASVHEDRRLIDSMWTEVWRVWFPDGKDDPSLVLLKVDPSSGEYWDNSGLEGIKYLWRAGKAYLSGEQATVDEDINATVKL
ncbi:pyridoxamine 5'-phosphate oxidase family protein [Neorhodopirellula pilleata]|uniref:General stress protein 26 n=1 Tax=Neorhodopirellula pilleata TaxID=2714738 RepID=A0A5C6AQK7_9BACT|nr:pyridoxamine 5'-phosphate oxidase family protein [Neorhodopirellula pilleata]TWU01741.1 General stress protein 26 [Neorhodopirellula pilleata]